MIKPGLQSIWSYQEYTKQKPTVRKENTPFDVSQSKPHRDAGQWPQDK